MWASALLTPSSSPAVRGGTRMNEQALRSRLTRGSCLQAAELLDLSGLGIVTIQSLSLCPKLRTVLLSSNNIECVSEAIHQCPQLWNIDLSNNKIYNLDGFLRFVALGELNLANNSLNWQELAKLRHLTVLHVRLHGNPLLERDPYYRIHVIDCLPNIWFLDGRLVTSAERVQAQNFFRDSALSNRPVRHKLPPEVTFVPSSMKELLVNGVFGHKATELLMQFPIQGPSNVDMDERRLLFYANNLVDDMKLECKYNHRNHEILKYNDDFMDVLLAGRRHELQRGNMLVLLLIASLEFSFPDALLKETLELAKLDSVGNVNCLDLFLLPKEARCLVAATLMASVKIERINKKIGGLYDRLYLGLNFLIAQQVRNLSLPREHATDSKQYRSLLAAEVVQLMCIVPSFFEYVQKEPGIMALAVAATGDTAIVQKLSQLTTRLQTLSYVDDTTVLKAAARLILLSLQQNLNLGKGGIKKDSLIDMIMCRDQPVKRPMSGPVYTSSYHAKGRSSPDARTQRVSSSRLHGRPKTPRVGDKVQLAPQSVARIASLPQVDLALLQVEQLSVNGSTIAKGIQTDDQYIYVDIRTIAWDNSEGVWKSKEMASDRQSAFDSKNKTFHGHDNPLPSARDLDSVAQDAGDAVVSARPVSRPEEESVADLDAASRLDAAVESPELFQDGSKSSHGSPEAINERDPLSHEECSRNVSGNTTAAGLGYNVKAAQEANISSIVNALASNPRMHLKIKIPQRETMSANGDANDSDAIYGLSSARRDTDSLIQRKENARDTRANYARRPHSAIPQKSASPSPRVSGLQAIFAKSPRPASAAEVYSLARRQEDRQRRLSSPTHGWIDSARLSTYLSDHDRQDGALVDGAGNSTQNASTERLTKTPTSLWLGGGKDLYQEELRKRQKTRHVPGYKENEQQRRTPNRLYGMLLHRCNSGGTTRISAVRGMICPGCMERIYA